MKRALGGEHLEILILKISWGKLLGDFIAIFPTDNLFLT